MSKANYKINTQNKSKVICGNFRKKNPLTTKGIYNKNYDKWKNILRADDSGKKLAAECLFYIAAIEFLFLTNPDEIIFDSRLLKKKSDHKQKQRSRFLKQLADLYNIKYHHFYVYHGEEVYGKFICTRTEESLKILENPSEFYEEKCPSNDCAYSQIRPYLQSNLTGLYTDNIEKEEEPSVHSSSFSSLCSLSPKNDNYDFVVTEIIVNTKTAQSEEIAAPKPTEGAISYPATNAGQGCLTIEEEKQHYGNHQNRDAHNNQAVNLMEVLANSMPDLLPTSEVTPQETIIEVPILATSSLAELAKIYQTEEIRSEATEVGTICDHLAGLRAIQDVPILTNVANIPNEEGGVITEQISTITQLTSEIFKAFDSKTSEKIMENCIFEELEPNKLGISIHAEFTISDHDKQKLKSCIRMAYGSDVQMVNTSVVKQKPTTSSETVRENRTIGEVASIKEHITSYPTQSSYKNEWDLMKVKIAEHFSENKYNHVMSVWLEKLNFARVEGDKIIVVGSCFYVDEVFNRFATAIDNAVVKTKKSLVLQYEGNAQRPIEFSYKQILSRR